MQTLRPFLVYSSGSFERKMLRRQRSIDLSLPVTKKWLRSAHVSFSLQTEPIKHPLQPQGFDYGSLDKKHQLYVSVVRGIVDIVFSPPFSLSTASTNIRPPTLDHLPETLYLDQGRIQNHSSEILDTVALWMFLLLYRQLASCSNQGRHQKERVDEYAAILKQEIRAIGPKSLGTCFLQDADSSSEDPSASTRSDQSHPQVTDKLKSAVDDVVLQIARRATSVPRNHRSPEEMASPPTNGTDHVPDERTVSVARKWIVTNMKTDSSFKKLLHGRLNKVVFERVFADVYPVRAASALEKMMGQEPEGCGEMFGGPSRHCSLPRSSLTPFEMKRRSEAVLQHRCWGNGLEILEDEVQSLVHKISLLVVVHFNAYLPLYEKQEFLQAVL